AKSPANRAGPPLRRFAPRPPTADVLCGLAARLRGCPTLFWSRQFHAGATGLGKTDGDRMLGRTGTVLAFTDVFHLFPDEFTGLHAGRLAFALVLRGTLQRLFVWHRSSFGNGHPPANVRQEVAAKPMPFERFTRGQIPRRCAPWDDNRG